MNPTTASIIRAVVRAARPWSLAAGVLLYALGGGIARYLGQFIDWPVYFIGQAALTLLQLSCYFLREYFDRATQPPFERLPRRQRPQAPPAALDGDGAPAAEAEPVVEQIIVPRVIFLQVAAATLTIGAVMTVLLIAENRLNPVAFMFLALAFVLGLTYAVPPFRLVYSGYGELVLAILVANLFPTLAYVLQVGELHRLLAMLTFPLTLIYLAGELARALQFYFTDYKENRLTMLVRLGWQRAMTLHNGLIAGAFILLSVSVIAGLPWRLAWPAFLTLPVAVFQIWQINTIAGGAKPRWRLLAYTAIATIGLMVYFMNLALWVS